MIDDALLQTYLRLGGTVLICLLLAYHYVITKPPLPKTAAVHKKLR
jgi:hypothetical protein